MADRRWIAGLGALAALLGAPSAAAAQVDTTCVLPLTKTDPSTINVAYPDEAAIYWIGAYQQVPGTRLRITGRYPHARYFSLNVYDVAQRPLDALADVEIVPDVGSDNPFAAGADRTSERRDFTAFVDFGPVPERRAPNTVYTGTGQTPAPNTTGTFILRVYIPDAGRDETGGVGLPTVTLESTLGEGSRPPASACADLQKPPAPLVQEASRTVALPVAPPAAATAPGQPVPSWVKFRNLAQVPVQFATNNPFLDDAAGPASQAEEAGGKGAFLSNIHNAYVYTFLNRAYGGVSVTEVQTPDFPDTRPGPERMPGGQLRYFSLCTNDLASQRFVACATDDQTHLDERGRAAYVVSTPAERPRWATADCGYTWLHFGPSSTSTLILRHMLPDPAFGQAIQRAEVGSEHRTMGEHLPTTTYLADPRERPCRASRQSSGPSLGLPPSSDGPRACVSRRRFTIRLRRGLRRVTIRVAGRRPIVLRGGQLRAPVDLRGLPRGTFRVRVRGVTRTGRVLMTVRTYRTCGGSGGAPG